MNGEHDHVHPLPDVFDEDADFGEYLKQEAEERKKEIDAAVKEAFADFSDFDSDVLSDEEEHASFFFPEGEQDIDHMMEEDPTTENFHCYELANQSRINVHNNKIDNAADSQKRLERTTDFSEENHCNTYAHSLVQYNSLSLLNSNSAMNVEAVNTINSPNKDVPSSSTQPANATSSARLMHKYIVQKFANHSCPLKKTESLEFVIDTNDLDVFNTTTEAIPGLPVVEPSPWNQVPAAKAFSNAVVHAPAYVTNQESESFEKQWEHLCFLNRDPTEHILCGKNEDELNQKIFDLEAKLHSEREKNSALAVKLETAEATIELLRSQLDSLKENVINIRDNELQFEVQDSGIRSRRHLHKFKAKLDILQFAVEQKEQEIKILKNKIAVLERSKDPDNREHRSKEQSGNDKGKIDSSKNLSKKRSCGEISLEEENFRKCEEDTKWADGFNDLISTDSTSLSSEYKQMFIKLHIKAITELKSAAEEEIQSLCDIYESQRKRDKLEKDTKDKNIICLQSIVNSVTKDVEKLKAKIAEISLGSKSFAEGDQRKFDSEYERKGKFNQDFTKWKTRKEEEMRNDLKVLLREKDKFYKKNISMMKDKLAGHFFRYLEKERQKLLLVMDSEREKAQKYYQGKIEKLKEENDATYRKYQEELKEMSKNQEHAHRQNSELHKSVALLTGSVQKYAGIIETLNNKVARNNEEYEKLSTAYKKLEYTVTDLKIEKNNLIEKNKNQEQQIGLFWQSIKRLEKLYDFSEDTVAKLLFELINNHVFDKEVFSKKTEVITKERKEFTKELERLKKHCRTAKENIDDQSLRSAT